MGHWQQAPLLVDVLCQKKVLVIFLSISLPTILLGAGSLIHSQCTWEPFKTHGLNLQKNNELALMLHAHSV